MQNKLVVWDLFGGGQNSVYLSLKEANRLDFYDVYTFDISEPIHDQQFKIDLAQDHIVEKFKQFPKPDIIVASPLCQSFSCVLNMKGGGTCFWKFNEDHTKLIERSVNEFEALKSGFTKNLKADVQLFIKRLGQKCIDNTIALIQHYQPRYWYIENPKQSLMWKYIQLNRSDWFDPLKYYLNETSYGKYGYFTTKATIFLSNVPMNLLKGKIEPPYTIETINGEKYYVLKDDVKTKVRFDLDSRMIGLASVNKMIKARNVKSGMGAMDFIQRKNTPHQKNKKTNEQISESGPASAIPHSLIQAIFSHFDAQAEVVNLITLVKAINGGIDLEQDRFDLVLFMIYGLWQKQYQTNLFALNFIKHKTKVVVIDRKSNFNDHERWKRFSVLITKAQREFLNLLIKQLLNVPVDKLKAIIMKNPLWVDQDKLNKLTNEQIKASFVMTWWNDCDLKFSFD